MEVKGKRWVLADQARLARWMGFLIEAQRWSGKTQTSVCKKTKTKSCNLSAFIASKGAVKNVGEQRLIKMLHETGAHQSGVLTAGLHRWDVITHADSDMINTFQEIVTANPAAESDCSAKFILVDDAQCFFLHRPSNVTTVMAKLPAQAANDLAKALGARIERAALNVASELQSLWLTDHAWVVDRAIDTYLAATPAHQT